MKKIMRRNTYLLMILMLIQYQVNGQYINIVQNPDFEAGTAPTGPNQIAHATGWNDGCGWTIIFDSPATTATLHQTGTGGWVSSFPGEPSVAHSGTRYAFFRGNGVSPSPTPPVGSKYYNQSVLGTITEPLKACSYKFGYWIATLVGPNPNIQVEMVLRKSDCSETPQKIIFTTPVNSPNWTNHEVTVTLTPTDVAQGYDRIEIRKVIAPYDPTNNNIDLYVDDVYILKEDINADVVAPSLLCNGEDLIVDGSNSYGEDDHFWYITEATPSGDPLGNPATTWSSWFTGPAGVFNFSNYVSFITPGHCYLIQHAVGNCFVPWDADYALVCVGEDITVNLGADQEICYGDPIPTLGYNYGAGYTYSWTLNSNPLSTNATVPATVSGNYCVTVTDPVGCVKSDCINITHYPQFNVAIVGSLAICGLGTTTLTAQVSFSPDPYTFSWSSGQSTPSISVSSAGTYTVTVTNTNTGCTASASVVVSSVDNWHQTTKNAAVNDVTKDVITDSNGDVYVTGHFITQTTLEGGNNPDVILSSGIPDVRATYIAKYSSCGDLLWEVHSVGSKDNAGNSLVIDEINERVYVTGDMETNISLTSVCTTANFTTTGYRGYVAALDKTTGCIEFLNAVSQNVYTRCEAIAINSTNGRIYIGGSHAASVGGVESSFIHRYIPTSSLGTPNIVVSTAPGGGNNKINDMDYFESTSKLWFVGTYVTDLKFPSPAPLLTVTGSATADAFVGSYVDPGTSGLTYSSLLNGDNAVYMTGEGICVNDVSGVPYVTGTFVAGLVGTPAFGIVGLSLPSNPGSPGNKAYMVSLGTGSTLWGHTGRIVGPPHGEVIGKSVGYRNGVAYFTGTFNQSALYLTPSSSPTLAYLPSSGVNQHTFIAAYTTTGAVSVRNCTADIIGNNAVHLVESIYTGPGGKSFLAGSYTNEMKIDAIVSSPLNDLVSTGGLGHYNGFILRVDPVAGAFKMDEVESGEENILSISPMELDMQVYPNPTNGQLTVEIKNFDAKTPGTVFLYNAIGKLVQQLPLTSEKINIDLSTHENGIYLVSYYNGETTQTVRVSKTN